MKPVVFLLLLAVLGACTHSGDDAPRAIRIAPTISTRVTGLYFDTGDRIGLRVVKSGADYQLNTPLSYDGAAFSAAGLLWYDTDEPATLSAYYPYTDVGFPTEFSVAADQRAGYEASDLLGAVKKEVQPAATPVGMLFGHLLSQLSVVVTNSTGKAVTDVVVSGLLPTATLDWSLPAATVKSGVTPVDIGAYCVTAGVLYRAIVVPQQVALTVKVSTDDGKIHTKTISQAQLDGGKRYDLAVTVTKDGLSLTLSGEISDWGEGGSLGGNDGGSDPDGDGDPGDEVVYDGVTYRTTTLAGKVWMAENLRYQPAGVTLENGMWYPEGNAANAATKGMLYNRTVALAGGTTPPVQGICPAGWHIPAGEELAGLLSSTPVSFFTFCGWWAPNLNTFMDSSKGLLMTSSLVESKAVYLSFSMDGTVSQKSLAADLGVSVRCVKN